MQPDARTASSPPLAPPSFLGDEQALKREFDSEFSKCLAAAREQLGDAGAMAPKVVETAFAALWNQRHLIGTRPQFETALADEVRHAAARTLSRRHSAARLAGSRHAQASHAPPSDAPPDVWANIERAIRGPAEQAGAGGTPAARSAHMRAMGHGRSRTVAAVIAAVVVLAAIGGVLYVDRLSVDAGAMALVSSPTIQPITSGSGQIGSSTLRDGSVMRMGPETKVYIPDAFPNEARVIRLEGTAAFQVAQGEGPFRVVAMQTHVIATGTNFVVSAYPGDSSVAVLVKEGTVTVKAGETETTLGVGQAVMVQDDTTRQPTADERAEKFGWVDGEITVRHKDLRVVVASLTRWFNFDVKVLDLPLLDRDASFDVPLDSSRLAIAQVEKSANVRFAYEGETKVFRDGRKR